MKSFAFTVFLLFVFSFSLLAQNPNPTSTPPLSETDDENTLKISTNLIQIDVTVTDKSGRVVKDLKPEDFEVFENGQKQDITNFSFISVDSKNKSSENGNSSKLSKNKDSIPIPSVKLKAEQVRRTYALVVDDLGLSFASTFWVQQSLKKFVNEQMQEGDLVAVVRTGSGIGALQSFTSDKQQLLAAIDKIKWNSYGRGGINTFEPIKTSLKDDMPKVSRLNAPVKGAEEDKAFERQIEEFRNNNFAVGTLGALKYTINGMSELPGRKAILFFSEGFTITSKGMPNRVLDTMKVLADLANRSSVVFYTLDPRGLADPAMPQAADDILEVIPKDFDPVKYVDPRADRISDFRESQQSLQYLAYETGGIPYINQNKLDKGIQQAIDDQSSYYLVGYQPNEDTFDPKKNKFNKLEVKIKRPDLKIRYRSGFFGVADEKLKKAPQNTQMKLTAALNSPFGANEVNLDLYSVFYNDSRNRSFIRSFVYIDPKDLTFTLDSDNLYRAKFDVLAVISDADGKVASNHINSHTLQFTKEQLATVREKGIIYDLPVQIIKPGAYRFRVALQNTGNGKVGSASQFVEIPNLNKKNLTLSNLIVKNYSVGEWKKISLKQNESNASDNSALLDTVTRRFKNGSVLFYSFVIYNGKSDAAQKPQMELRARLFYQGKMISEGAPSPIKTEGQTDLQRLNITNAVTLGTDLSPGDYALQVIVYDKLSKESKQAVAQSIDFEIIK